MKNHRLVILLFVIFPWVVFSGCDAGTKVVDSCGDGFLDPGEECDGSEMVATNCQELGYYEQFGALKCKEDCTLDVSVCSAGCGDGVVQSNYGEVCDGVNLMNTSCQDVGLGGGTLKCKNNCRFDASECEIPAICGDGTITGPFEKCEGDNLNGQSCVTQGFASGSLSCDGECGFDLRNCSFSTECGDSVAEGEEQCDDTDLKASTCESLGYYAGVLGCSNECMFDVSNCQGSGHCGDGLIEPLFEQCDGTALDGQDCQQLGYHGGTLVCAENCTLDISDCVAEGRCGDGIIQVEPEQCDGTALDGQDCQQLGYHGGTLVCAENCTLDISDCVAVGRCGDGIIQPETEQCEALDLAGATCESLGQNPHGLLVCDNSCHFALSLCNAVNALASGREHTCIIHENGNNYCWGYNNFCQLGIGSPCNIPVYSPVLVSGSHQFSSFSAASYTTCAIDTAGSAYCWGINSYGQLGDGTINHHDIPNPVSGGHTFVSIKNGLEFTCALSTDGDIYCWGRNNSGQLGDGTTTQRMVPTLVLGGHKYVYLSSGSASSCAIATGGESYCWGGNGDGQLGNNSTIMAMTPTLLQGTPMVSISVGGTHACAISTDNLIYCWGDNSYGQLGDGSFTRKLLPVQVLGGYSFHQVTAGTRHTCGITAQGNTYCWGYNNWGQLGNNNTINQNAPVTVLGGILFSTLALGFEHTCGISSSHDVYCWGLNDNGELGDGTIENRAFPTLVSF